MIDQDRSRSGRCGRCAVAASALAFAVAALVAPAPAGAQAAAPPQGLVHLSSSATLEVPRDLMTLTFGTTRDGPDAASVQAQLRQALDAALAEARRAARPGELEVRTGLFAVAPRYGTKGTITGWQGSTELTVEGRDMAAIGQLAGRITTLSVSRQAYGLSRELRAQSESEVASQAIGRYRVKAADYAKQFGYAGYVLQQVSVSSVDGAPSPPRPIAMRATTMSQSVADDALPIEAGKGSITITVEGTVQLTR